MLIDDVWVSVVIPTWNRPHLLDRCLRALVVQSFDARSFEIVIADDVASSRTERQVARWAERAVSRGTRIQHVPVSESRGPAGARNAGWRRANGEIIAFTDDDCCPHPDWLSRGVAAMTNDVDGVAGRIVVPLDHRPTDYERNAALLEWASFPTANCFYRRSALEAVGGFDERFEMAWREDSDLQCRLREAGFRLIKEPAAIVIHPIRPSQWGISLRQQRKSMYNALLYRKHPRAYRELIQSRPPLHYYAMLACLCVGTISRAMRCRRVAMISAWFWAALTVRFCSQRLRGTSRAPAHVAEMVVTSALIPPLAVYWRLRGAIRYRVWFL